MSVKIPVEEILVQGPPPLSAGETIGTSREGRPVRGFVIGRGPFHVSLVAGCHADEPVGPAMLDRLVSYLLKVDPELPLLSRLTFRVVPHVNPDGEARNAAWTSATVPAPGGGTAYDLALYVRRAEREKPGDDVEFGFPRSPDDNGARPENRAVAGFLRAGGTYVLHASFHGMAFAAGPWFLMEAAWAERTADMRQRLRHRVAELGYVVHDVDRGGEKGFSRIDEGFTTRPDSRAMAAHFEALGDPQTAGLFRPSSMEFVRSLGGDPLTLVSEMPLFLLPAEHFQGDELVRPPVLGRLAAVAGDADALRAAAAAASVRPMPIEDQVRLQLAYLEEGLAAALESC